MTDGLTIYTFGKSFISLKSSNCMYQTPPSLVDLNRLETQWDVGWC